MNSAPNGPESVEISRQEVIDAYKKFVERGITSPDNLNSADLEVIEANNLNDKWQAQEGKKSEGNEDSEKRTNFEKTMLFVDAGFTDANYLNDVLDWLSQDSQNAEKDSENTARVELRKDMSEAMKKIKKLAAAENLDD